MYIQLNEICYNFVMTRKELIEAKYIELGSYAAVGRALNLSRQRVHQIVKNYKHFGRFNRAKIYDKAWKDTCQICLVSDAIALHHIDGNNENDDIANLLPVCRACHYKTHVELRKTNETTYGFKYTNCGNCGKEFNYHFRPYGKHRTKKGMCKDCCIKHYSSFCITCNKTFDSEFVLHAKDRCYNCYAREVVNKSARSIAYRKKYYLEHRQLIGKPRKYF